MVSASQVDEWQVHKVYPNYEINAITLLIRNRKTQRILAISTRKDGYQIVNLDGKTKQYHRVIALLFIPNPDPEHLTEVNHKNHIRNENRIENLEWITPSANRKDRLPFTQSKKRFTDELPEGSIPITQYKGLTFDGYYFIPTTEEILKKGKDRFQYLSIKNYSTKKRFSLYDTNQVQHGFGLKSLLRTFQT